MEARRDEFRNYLETSGAITALTNVLIKLFEMPEKPENSVQFICQNLGGAALEQEISELKLELAEAQQQIQVLSSGRASNASKFRFSVTGPEQNLEILTHGFDQLQQNEECTSLLKHYLTVTIIQELAHILVGACNSTLLDCVQAGFYEQCTPVGILAAEPECYTAFAALFDPIIRHYHRYAKLEFEQPAVDWGDHSTLTNPDPEKAYIQKAQINCYRSLPNFPYFLKMDENHYVEVMETIRPYAQANGQANAYHELETIDDDLHGQLHSPNTLGEADFIFDKDEGSWESSKYSAHWPKGRAIYVGNEKDMAIRVNHKTHLQFGCVDTDGDLIAMYERMSNYGKNIEEHINCARDEKYGWLTPFPQYLGTAMEISALVKLHHLPKDECKFKDFLDTLHLKVARIEPDDEDSIYYCDLRNARCLGLTEIELMQEFCSGLAKVFEAERESNAN